MKVVKINKHKFIRLLLSSFVSLQVLYNKGWIKGNHRSRNLKTTTVMTLPKAGPDMYKNKYQNTHSHHSNPKCFI